MRRRPTIPQAPLAQRDGIDPVRLRLPADGPWATVREYLLARYPARVAERLEQMLHEGRILGADGPIGPGTAFAPQSYLWFHRDLPEEEPAPFGAEVLYRDEHLLVADKPHFLATTPRGRHVTQTVLAQLRRDLDLPQLSPAHRLDRLTAGLAMFVITPEHRGAYQTLFSDRLVRKEYEAVAPYDPQLALPRTVRSHIVKERGVIAARELPGEPNSESRIELLERRGRLGRYRLSPHTGRTHQLRLHMSSLGIPIVWDPVYPVVLADDTPEDFDRPLQLLARRLEFTDPVTGAEHVFTSRRTLSAWSGPTPADGA